MATRYKIAFVDRVQTFTLAQTVAALFTTTKGIKVNRTASAAGNYNVLSTDYIVAKTGITGGGDTVTLPDATTNSGQVFIIKDESGSAATNNITVATAAGNIDGVATFTMNVNYGSAGFYSNGTNYFVI